jgi:hypothetical protein
MAWDPQKSRYPLINGILTACGAQPRWFEEVAAIQQAELSRCCCLAVVALGACPSPADYSLEVVRSLKSQGFRVIGYGEGAQAWRSETYGWGLDFLQQSLAAQVVVSGITA